MVKPVLIVGATRGIGRALASELLRRRRPVRILARSEAAASAKFNARHLPAGLLRVIEGNALDERAVVSAAEGCGAIVHSVGYPFAQWSPNMERATQNVIAAARFACRGPAGASGVGGSGGLGGSGASGVTVLFPGNVYPLPVGAPGPLKESTPLAPWCEKGRLRARLEGMLREAASPTLRVLIVRAGDYFGPSVRNGLTDRVFIPALKREPLRVLGDLSRPRQWAFTPDLAWAMASLLDAAGSLEPFDVVHFGGHAFKSGRAFFELLAQRVGAPDLPISQMPWWQLRLAGWFDDEARHVAELRPLLEHPTLLDDTRLAALLPQRQVTPVELAIDETLAAYRQVVDAEEASVAAAAGRSAPPAGAGVPRG